jgi:M6 family metalloprotease-like protein
MKRIALVLAACFFVLYAHAAYLKNVPKTLTQPDGTVLHCFASGDEFFNYLHDANGYTIIQHPVTGYYVYADKQDGKLVATDFIAGKYDPASKNLTPYNLISPEEWRARRKAWEVPDPRPKNRDYIPNHGTLNNIAIFIRFSDDGEFTNTYSSIDNMFNDESSNAVSMKTYFRAASYGAIEIPTYFYPGHNGETIISYQDTYPKSYFQPYNASTNPNGYQDDERAQREFDLLERAVNYINANYPIPADLNIDYDSDGYVDNVCFIVKGDVGAWSSLLWPHKWNLQDRTVRINGKRVWTFNFQLADATSYFNTSTMCHEMNHSLGAPDLYHYLDVSPDPDPVGPWDLMDQNSTPPQHCGAYMKMKYGHWIDEIPEITQAGTYTLNPISSATPTNVAYKIASSDPNQFYVLEYRDQGTETALPGSGLLIYRIDTRFDGNADYYPADGVYDEIYIFRPDGTYSTQGNLRRAHFSSNVNRTEFSPSTSPYPFFSDGTLDNNMRIYDITSAGSTISFKYGSTAQCEPPTNLVAAVDGKNVILTWDAAANAVSYNVYRNGNLVGNTTSTSFTDSNLPYGVYHYTVRSVDSNDLNSTSSNEATASIQPIPSMLTVSIDDDDAVLTWTEPDWDYPSTPLATLTYGSQSLSSSVGYGDGTTKIYWGHKYPAEDISIYDGKLLYAVSFYANATGNYKVFIYEGSETDTYHHPVNQVAEQSATITVIGWSDVLLSTPHTIDGTEDLWVFIYDDNAYGFPASYCPYNGENGNYYSTSPTSWTGTWSNSAFLIKTYLTDGAYTYNLYDGATPVATNIEGTTYTITNITNEDAAHLYTLTTNTSNGETDASNLAGLTIGTASLSSLSMAANDKMTVTEGSKLTVSGTLSDVNPANLILEDGAQLVNNSGGVYTTVKKNITAYTAGEKDGWNLIASPITEDITPTVDNGLLANSYDLYIFDQSQSLEWRNYEATPKPFTTIENKKGYLYANNGNPTLSFTGTLAASVEPTALVYDANAFWKGFNLIGNPYPCNTYVTDRPFYVLQENATTHQSEFALGVSTQPIAPGQAILVEAQGEGESVSFSKTAPTNSSKSINIAVTKANMKSDALLDKARVSFNEGEQLTKYSLNANHSRLYIPCNGHDLAVACAKGESELPLSFKAAENGTYTLAIEVEGLELDYLHLIDNMTGEDVDLLAAKLAPEPAVPEADRRVEGPATYTFEAKTTDYASRFRLVFAPEEGGASTGSATFAYYANGEIIITGIADACNASLQVMDMTGRIVRCGDVSGNVSTAGMTPGVYVLRLIDGENVRTQKIVIE